MESTRQNDVREKSAKRGFRSNKKHKQAEKYKKFLGSSSEGQGFADKRKKKIKYEYLKYLQKEKLKKGKFTCDGSPTEEKNQDFRREMRRKKGMNSLSHLVKKQKIHKEKAQKEKQEAEKKRQEKEEAINTSRQKRKQNYKLLCKRTAKGQPVMKCQMEFLLAKIEKQINQT